MIAPIRPMRRRAFLRAAARLSASAAGFGLLSGCDIGPADIRSSTETRPVKVARVGILSGSISLDPRLFDALREGLRELGWIEGQNVTFEELFNVNSLHPNLAAALIVNLSAAERIGLTIPGSVLRQATEVVR